MKIIITVLNLLLLVGCHRHSPPVLTVDIDRSGHLSIDHAYITKKQLYQILQDRYGKYGEYPVTIRAVSDTRFSDIQSVIKIGLPVGIWHYSFADESGPVSIDLNYQPVWEPEVTPEGDAVPNDSILIHVSEQGANTTPLQKATPVSNVVILCSSNSHYADLMTALRLCESKDISEVYVWSTSAPKQNKPDIEKKRLNAPRK